MPTQIKMPALSPTMEEGTLAKWLVKVGDSVSAGDIMAEIETDKATMEFEAVDEGTITQILVPEGTDGVKVGDVIAVLAAEGEDVSSSAPPAKAANDEEVAPTEAAKPAKSDSDVSASPLARKMADAAGVDLSSIAGTGPDGKIVKADIEAAGGAAPTKTQPKTQEKSATVAQSSGTAGEAPPAPVANGARIIASPLARRIAAQHNVDLSQIAGSGPGGRIVKADVEGAPTSAPGEANAAAEQSEAPKPAAAQPVVDAGDIPHETVKLSGMRKTIARRLTESKQQVPHIYLTVDIQLDKLLDLRKELNASLEPQGIKLSVNDLLIKALAKALIAVPACNVSYAGDTLIKYNRADISVAVSIDGGLITPIVTDANSKAVSAISTEMKELADKAKSGKLAPHEYQGGTASLSNMGMFGIKQFDAVINPPQAMIMAISAGEPRPYVVDGALSVATVMSATGSFDHRAIDGADGAELMKAFKTLVENPLEMLA